MTCAANSQHSGVLAGKVTVVTGASSGIGRAIAKRFAGEGSSVVVTARRVERLEKLKGEIEAAGGRALAIPADVTQYARIEQVIEATTSEFGRIDVMVNNAGNAVAKPLTETSVAEIDSQLDVNLRALIFGCKSALPHMIAAGGGNIINIGSICSMRHYADYATYVAAKFGVLGFSRSLYEEVREQGVRVNCLCPAAVNTEWPDLAGAELPWPREQRLQSEDLAEVALMCVTMPARVQIEQVVLWPTCEATT